MSHQTQRTRGRRLGIIFALMLCLLTLAGPAAASIGAYYIYYNDEPQDYEGRSSVLLETIEGGYSLALNDSSLSGYGRYWNQAETLSNSDNLTLSSAWSSSTAYYAGSSLRGIYSSADGTAVENSGAIILTGSAGTTTTTEYSAMADATGIYAYGDITNAGSISIDMIGGTSSYNGSGYINGAIYSSGENTIVTNYGSIDISATGGTASTAIAYALGIYGAQVDNHGEITVLATGGTQTGSDSYAYVQAQAVGITGSIISNDAAIRVTAQEGSSSLSHRNYNVTTAAGIVSDSGRISNSGDLVVSAYGTTAAPIADTGRMFYVPSDADAFGLLALDSSVVNSGNITVTADNSAAGTTAAAYGIYMYGSDLTLTNFGSISATGDRAYEVYIADDSSVSLSDTYTMTLADDSTSSAFYIGHGATLALNDAALSLVTSAATRWNTEYSIFEVAEATSDYAAGTVDGSFGTVTAINPDVTVVYNDQGTEDSSDDSVSVTYDVADSGSEAATGAAVTADSVFLATTQVNQQLLTKYLDGQLVQAAGTRPQRKLYADSGLIANDAGPQVDPSRDYFFIPYYSHQSLKADPLGYSADSIGFVTGLDQSTRSGRYGFHLGYSRSSLDYTGSGYSGNSEQQDLFSGGIHFIHNYDNLTVRSQLTAFYSRHDYDGLTGASRELTESADYGSYGLSAELLGGYLIRRGDSILLPEAGLSYQWLHQDRFTTDASDSSWDATCSKIVDDELSLVANLRWLSHYQQQQTVITPSLAGGLRYQLTDDDISVRQSVEGSNVSSVTTDGDDLTATLAASVEFARGGQSVEVAYNGEYGEQSGQSSVWLRFVNRF